MKNLFTILVILFLAVFAGAQSPEKMSYQAVIRDASNNLVTNQLIGMQISILQGSVFGTYVYVETQSPYTNANGLVTIEIGDGTIESGDFSAIDWTNGPYFLKTEIDPAGGTNYAITGTSQLLSVPYALHAKTAESLSGLIAESDPFYSGSEAANITATDITNLDNLSGTNTGDQDLSDLATKSALGDSIARLRRTIPETYSIGDYAQGGIVFYVDKTGRHGLVVTKEDQSAGVRWYAGTYGKTQAKGDGLYSGVANTTIILAAQAVIGDDDSPYAALICNQLRTVENNESYGDWYLPSRGELTMMYLEKSTINATAIANGGNALADAYYWCSNELNNYLFAWRVALTNGNMMVTDKAHSGRVRAVRAF
ncbi:DUF1566 domain-containing protein [Marinilabilia salmonicolor]|uniref:DUF1566 domain-containing protein n=1 Tax=Marinilabilia salmonicolor TaxID=989 RepID=UPI00029B4EF3|nr:DUF1566 domain-containing protein [Marinilabilia salmonicolor]